MTDNSSAPGVAGEGRAGHVSVITQDGAPPPAPAAPPPAIMGAFDPWLQPPEAIALTQDHGPIPAGKWAGATAALILRIEPTASDAARAEAQGYIDALAAALTERFAVVQVAERQALEVCGADRLDVALDAESEAAIAVDATVALAAGKSFAAHFDRPEIRDYLRRHIAIRFRTAMHIERLWWCDRHPESNAGAVYKATHQGA